jgi:H/ACA ribonucleoprotein complex subunit 4
LRRIRAGNFTEEEAHSLVEVKDAYELWKEGNEKLLRKILLPIDYAIPHVKKVFVKDSAVYSICNGAPVYPKGLVRVQEGILAGETVAVYSLKEELVALGIAKLTSEKMVKAKRGVAVRTDRVIMAKGVYPKIVSKV